MSVFEFFCLYILVLCSKPFAFQFSNNHTLYVSRNGINNLNCLNNTYPCATIHYAFNQMKKFAHDNVISLVKPTTDF